MSRKSLILKCCLLVVFASALLLLVLAAGSGGAEGKTITVDDDGGANYEKIQDAINASEEGDTVIVETGIYNENVIVNKSISIKGNGNDTEINGNKNSATISIISDNVEIETLLITNGNSIFVSGIIINANYTVIRNNSITCPGSYGITISDSHSSLIEGNYFSGNYIGSYFINVNNISLLSNHFIENENRGMSFSNVSNSQFQDNNFSNNTYGIYAAKSNGNVIEKNFFYSQGIGIYFERINNNNTICENIFRNCRFGITVSDHSIHNKLRSNIMINNEKFGISLTDCNNNIVEMNEISLNKWGIGLNIAYNNVITNNTITLNEIGIYLTRSSINNTIIFNNILSNWIFGISAEENEGYDVVSYSNWWGHSSGPYHPENNTNGKGDNVTDYVEFKPWLKVPVDFVAPTPVIESISPNPALVSDTVVFVGAVLDDRTIERYVWRNNTQEMYNGTEPEFSLSSLLPGTYTIYFKVRDSDYEAWSEEVSTTLIVHQKPTASITLISPSPALATDSVHFEGVGTDDGTVERYVWTSSIDGEIHNGAEANFTNSSLSVGTHTISFRVQDNYGVWSNEATATLTVNEYIPPNKLPTVTITSPADGATLKGTVIIKGTASDPDGTVETVDVLVDGEWFQATGTTTWEYELDTTKLENWDYVLKVLAFDGTDYSEDALLNITVDNEEEDGDGDGFLPGFEIAAFLVGAVVGVAGWRRRKKT